MTPAVDHNLGARRGSAVDVGDDPVPMGLGHERAHLRVRVVARPNRDRRDPLRNGADELVGDRGDRNHDRHRHAPLSRRPEAGRDCRIGSLTDIGVGQHDHVVLRPPERLHPLARLRGRLVDVAGDGGGPDETHGPHQRVPEQPVDGFGIAVHYGEDAVRQARIRQEPCDEDSS